MAKERKKPYDRLPEIPFGTRPRVLLIGNGLNRAFDDPRKSGSVFDTECILKKEWEKAYKSAFPEKPKRNINDDPFWKLSLPQQVVVATKNHVRSCMNELAVNFRELIVSQSQQSLIEKILDTPFDAILSTNYSLEFEKSIIPNYTDKRAQKCYRTTSKPNKQQELFGVFQCTELPFANHPLLWHIHGTALRKDSLVMGQFYYGKLLREVIERANAVNASYSKSLKIEMSFSPKSWVDYFLIGDIYVFGFGFDLSESDLWWLLSYKKSAFPESKIFFYEPQIAEEKHLLLKCYQVNTPDIVFNNDESDGSRYIRYYEKICEDISQGNRIIITEESA